MNQLSIGQMYYNDLSLLRDRQLRNKTAQAGRIVLEREYTAAVNGLRIQQLIEQLYNRGNT